jgi:predicted esterase
VEAFLASVEPNRRRWLARLNPPALPVTGPLERRAYVPLSDIGAEWLTLPLGPLDAEAVLAVPSTRHKKYSLVIALHGLGGSPEGMFGLEQEGNYHAYARRLLERGWAVLAPLNICGVDRRNRLERLCRLADTTLSGIELVRLQHLVDAVLADERIDGERVAGWGLSLGGRELLFWMPLEPRIRVGIVSGWFNRRPEKMAVPSERYSCFLETAEEHAFLQGWLTEFADVDVVSLIVPRPLLIQTGKKDSIAYWPDVETEFKSARQPYERLGMGERMEFDLHEGGHELRLESGLAFLDRWLGTAIPESMPER